MASPLKATWQKLASTSNFGLIVETQIIETDNRARLGIIPANSAPAQLLTVEILLRSRECCPLEQCPPRQAWQSCSARTWMSARRSCAGTTSWQSPLDF